jgi:lipoate-protein ligase A
VREVRGRFDVPGRRCAVVVSAADDDGVLRRVEVRLALEDAGGGDIVGRAVLERLGEALSGATMTDGVAHLRERLTAAPAAGPGDAVGPEWLPEATVIAARRALGGASEWADHTFEVIHDGPLTPAGHMALDQVLAEAVGSGERGPTLRIWEWERPCVVIGSFQSLSNEVDPDGAGRHGVTVVRRVSGGGAMFIQPEGAITFSLTVPGSLVAGMSFATSYAYLDDWVVRSLVALGIDARYVPLNDIASPRGKIAGAAQKRLASGAVLHHVTMAYDMDPGVMLDVLRTFRPHVAERGTKSAQKHVDPLRSQTVLSRDAVIDALKASFGARYRCVDGAVTGAERARAERLAAEKFATPEWTARVP